MIVVCVLTLVLIAECAATPVSRIIEGTETTIETFPSAVQLEFFFTTSNAWSHSCGANILNELYILSAAHCTDPAADPTLSPETRRIRAGATNRNTGGIIRNVASILNHPAYNIATFVDADICIIRLRELLTFSSGVQSIAILPQDFVIPDNDPAVHAGWGLTHHGSPSPVLLYVNQVHRANCNNVPTITNFMVCVSSPTNGIDGPCSMDSGGPLYYGNVLAGVVSFTYGSCFQTGRTIVSGRVAAVTNWILDNTP